MKGLIFIPDISGFTQFVKHMPLDLGAEITSDLLQAIIDENNCLQLSEVEGDALLFYKTGEPLPLEMIMDIFQRMNAAFTKKFDGFKRQYQLQQNLSLKVIIHYGEIKVYDIMGFKKLYGEAVIESHKLLKNQANADHYVLITDEYIQALELNVSDLLLLNHNRTQIQTSFLNGINKIACYFFRNFKKHLVFQP